MKKTNIQTIAIITFIAILVGVGGYLTFRNDNTELKTYVNQNYGVTFQYPNTYKITENQVVDGQTGTIVTLTEKGITIPTNGEGPTAITIAMYEGTGTTTVGNQDPLLAWIRTSPYSNFTLSAQQDPGTTMIADQDARLYTWDGLYQGTTVVTLNRGNVIMFSVTYDGEADLKKREDFSDLVASVRLGGTGTSTSTPAVGNE
jgi:hypothetical protein